MTGDGSEEPSRLRGGIAVVLAILSAVALSLAVDAFWLDSRIFDTEAFVEAAAPLPQDPSVSTAIAAAAAEAVAGSDVEARIEGALPDPIDFLAPTFTDFAADLAFDATESLVRSEAFSTIWVAMLERTHAGAMRLLDDEGTAEPVVLDLDQAADAIYQRLGEAGVVEGDGVAASLGEIVLIEADTVSAFNGPADVFRTALWVFPVLGVLLLGAAVLVDWDRLRSVEVAGFSLAGFSLLSVALFGLARNAVVGAAENPVNEAALATIWEAYSVGYVPLALAVGAVGLVTGIATWWIRRAER